MTVSVVIPAYNSSSFLPATIESVLAQSLTDWELIVVNDGSTDDTEAVAMRYAGWDSRIRVLSQLNRGLSGARNAGYRHTAPSSEFVCFLDADDLWMPDTLSRLCGALRSAPDSPAAYGLATAIDSDGRALPEMDLEHKFRRREGVLGSELTKWPPHLPTSFECFVLFNWVVTAGVLMARRSALTQSGLFDEQMGGCADWDMWLRLSRIGALAFSDSTVLRYRMHADGMSRKSRLMAEDEAYLRRKLLMWPGNTPEQQQLCEWGYRYRARQVSGYRLTWAGECLRRGQIVQSAKQLRHAARSYWSYALGSSA